MHSNSHTHIDTHDCNVISSSSRSLTFTFSLMFYKGVMSGVYKANLDGSRMKKIVPYLPHTPSLAVNLDKKKICAAVSGIPKIFSNLSK